MIRKQQRSYGGGRFLRKETLMKKIISFLLILVMVLAAVGCSSEATEPTEYSATDVTYSSDSPSAGSVSHPGKAATGTAKEDSGSVGSSATGSVSGTSPETVIESPSFRSSSEDGPATTVTSDVSSSATGNRNRSGIQDRSPRDQPRRQCTRSS